MGKRGPKAAASEAVIMDKILSGMGDTAISKELGVSRPVVAAVRKDYMTRQKTITNVDELKPLLKIELTQEIAQLGLGKILYECEQNYMAAKAEGDMIQAGGWLKQWQDAVEKLLRVTGCYEKRVDNGPKDISVKVEFV